MRISVPAELGEDFSAQCFDLGSCGVQYDEQPDQWSCTVYFDANAPIDFVRSELARYLERRGCDASCLEADTEPERDWSTEWRSFLQPVQATERIRIRPPWTPPGGRQSQSLCSRASRWGAMSAHPDPSSGGPIW